MFEKTQFSNTLVLGNSVTEQPFFLTEIRSEKEFRIQGKTYQGFILTFQDRTGNVEGFLPADKVKNEYSALINSVVAVNGIVLRGDAVFIKVDSLTAVEKGNYDPKYFMIGLDDAKRRAIMNLFKREIEEVKHVGYKKLLQAVFTDKMLEEYAERPASLKQFANYHGGLLVSTAMLWHLVHGIAASYEIVANGIYSKPLDKDLLYTAALLYGVGRVEEWTQFPYKKSSRGMLQGTVGTVQRFIADKCRNIEELSEEEEIFLISTIVPALDGRNQVKATTKEAVILQQALMLYRTCDEYDKALYDYQGDEDIFYSWQIRAYVTNENEKVG